MMFIQPPYLRDAYATEDHPTPDGPIMRPRQHVWSSAAKIEPQMEAMGFERIGSGDNFARFTDGAKQFPIVILYGIGRYGIHLFRVKVEGLPVGIVMRSPWVMWGLDTFTPRLEHMQQFAAALRTSTPTIPSHEEPPFGYVWCIVCGKATCRPEGYHKKCDPYGDGALPM